MASSDWVKESIDFFCGLSYNTIILLSNPSLFQDVPPDYLYYFYLFN